MQDLYVTWDEYRQMIEQLVLQIHASGYRFDSLLCIALIFTHIFCASGRPGA